MQVLWGNPGVAPRLSPNHQRIHVVVEWDAEVGQHGIGNIHGNGHAGTGTGTDTGTHSGAGTGVGTATGVPPTHAEYELRTKTQAHDGTAAGALGLPGVGLVWLVRTAVPGDRATAAPPAGGKSTRTEANDSPYTAKWGQPKRVMHKRALEFELPLGFAQMHRMILFGFPPHHEYATWALKPGASKSLIICLVFVLGCFLFCFFWYVCLFLFLFFVIVSVLGFDVVLVIVLYYM